MTSKPGRKTDFREIADGLSDEDLWRPESTATDYSVDLYQFDCPFEIGDMMSVLIDLVEQAARRRWSAWIEQVEMAAVGRSAFSVRWLDALPGTASVPEWLRDEVLQNLKNSAARFRTKGADSR